MPAKVNDSWIVRALLITACTVGMLLQPGTTADASPSTESADDAMTVFPTVMTHNLMLLPSGITDWEPDLRARLAGDASYLKADDIFVLVELFDNSATDEQLFPRLAAHHPYRTPVIGRSSSGWNRTTGGYYGTPLEDGGVAIVSKWPIVYQAQHIYGGGCGTDYWAAKGFAYAVIDVAGTRVHVVGTHLQANDSGCGTGEARQERAAQMNAITSYLAQQDIPASEPVIIAGDFNVRQTSTEYPELLSRLHVSTPPVTTASSATHDPTTNSIAKYRDPESSPSRLDYVFLRTDHTRPPKGWINKILPSHSSPYLMRGRTFFDYADHYPVSASPAP
ncbi:sphingomyelin phosphodiesterase [Streptomyces sp. NPDC004787]|uniref:sphingomyelin phosphodiesterase n=1 Tax=Streptomyces sp. NPDC004787 TaxID=3154291 RepID=UPI0033AAF8A9